MVAQAHVRTEAGTVILMDLPLDRFIQERVDKGYLRIIDRDHSDGPRKPAINDPKKAWVGWAVQSTRDGESPVSPDDADAMTKQDLIDRFG